MNCPKCNASLLPMRVFAALAALPYSQPPICHRRPQAFRRRPPASRQHSRAERFILIPDGRGQGRGYTWAIEYQGAFALAVVNLQPEQSISAEAGAMVSMSANVDLESQMKGGVFGALKRAVGGESAFVSTFTARGGPGEVTFAPGAPGDVAGIEMTQPDIYGPVELVSRGRHEP